MTDQPRAAQRATTNNGLAIDRAEAERFLDLIGRGDVHHTFQTFDDSRARREARAERNKVHKQRGEEEEKDPFAIIFHGTLAEHFDSLVRLNNAGAGIFVTINETDGGGRSKKNITKVRALFVDRDDRNKPRPAARSLMHGRGSRRSTATPAPCRSGRTSQITRRTRSPPRRSSTAPTSRTRAGRC
jgi:hypothetical protein